MKTLKVMHYQQLFANSDNDEEFEGFGLDDILDNIDILNEIDFNQSLKDQEMIEDVDIGWERNDAVPICTPFTGNPGLNVKLPQNPEPIDIFNLLFKPEMWDRLTTQTNLYAENRIAGEQLKEKSRLPAADRQGFKHKQTSFYCPQCDVLLCTPDCFEQYHTKKHYQTQIELENSGQSSDNNSE